MVANERIAEWKARMRRCLGIKGLVEECQIDGIPATMLVTYYDGVGIQFRDAGGKPLLPDLIRDEELAITIWNTLTNNSPIDPAWFE